MLGSSSGRTALNREGSAARAPAPRDRNLIHTSSLAALSAHRHGGGQAEGTLGLLFKARL